MTLRPPEYDTDVLVVGSGFGGSVAALRLAEKGYRVTVLESGRRFADDELPRTSWDLRRYLWAPALGCFGIQRIHRLSHVVVLAGAGVGGGSLNYANTLYVPPESFFRSGSWAAITDWQAELAPHYDQASRMLGVVVNPCDGPAEQVMARAAAELGVADTLAATPVGVLFSQRPGERVSDPFFGGAGPARVSCTQCGSCMTGCRVGAKNSLTTNYLALAERAGAQVRPLRTVVRIEPIDPDEPGEGYRVTHQATGPAWRRRRRTTTTARFVIVAAGTWGTQSLLHDCRLTGALPRVSPVLGRLTRTNSEALLGANIAQFDPDVDLSRGIAITRSFHPSSDTHIENVRYGAGSNAMGLLGTLLVDGPGPGDDRPRWRRFLGQALRQPRALLTTLDNRRWSQRTIIGLVMQNRDNSLTVSARRRGRLTARLTGAPVRLISAQGHGEPNPTWIPAGHKAIRVIAGLLGDVAGQRATPGGTLGDVVDVPMTAHFLGGCPIGASPQDGVVDAYHRLFGYPGISVLDGSTISANLGVNPSLSITAQAERAVSLWPNSGDADPRPAQGEPYRRLDRVRPRSPVVPAGAPGELR